MIKDNLEVEVGPHPEDSSKRAAVVKDVKANRAWSGEGATDSEATTEAVRKFVGDRRTKEYLP